MPEAIKCTRGSRELDRILVENGSLAKAIKRKYHRSVLWRFRTGRRIPELVCAVRMARVTKGRIPEPFWTQPVRA